MHNIVINIAYRYIIVAYTYIYTCVTDISEKGVCKIYTYYICNRRKSRFTLGYRYKNPFGKRVCWRFNNHKVVLNQEKCGHLSNKN